MVDKEEKRIKALELEHQELISFLHTLSWIMFTVIITGFLTSLSFSMNGEVKSALFVIILLMAAPTILCYKGYREISNRAKDIRNQILEL